MKKFFVAAVAGAVLGLAASLPNPALAQGKAADVTDIAALRAAVKADKKAFVASTLQLTDAEAVKFWPAYNTYQRSAEVANRRRVLAIEGVISTDKPISDLYAKKLANELLAADDGELKARRALYPKVMKALPPKKAARYLQLESKIRAVYAYDVAEVIPLIK